MADSNIHISTPALLGTDPWLQPADVPLTTSLQYGRRDYTGVVSSGLEELLTHKTDAAPGAVASHDGLRPDDLLESASVMGSTCSKASSTSSALAKAAARKAALRVKATGTSRIDEIELNSLFNCDSLS